MHVRRLRYFHASKDKVEYIPEQRAAMRSTSTNIRRGVSTAHSGDQPSTNTVTTITNEIEASWKQAEYNYGCWA